ncbi:MAG TPA: serine hydrolase domain-containing protein [Burkholderiales bacterium]|jgi:CubicO group peptidase (beta-lactamase class C family)|nr:serine hydrolase domain-containing protein [Burkholderiales bacterium]
MVQDRIAVALAACIAFSTAAFGADPLPRAAPESVGMSAQRLARIAPAFREHVEKGRLPGAVFLVARHGKLVYADAVGLLDPGKGRPMRPDAIFRIYSMTKPLVSVGAMMLVEDGRMQLNDPVSKFLPAMKGLKVSVAKIDAEFAKSSYAIVPAEREMTVQDLLRHTSGLAYANLTQNNAVKEAYTKAGIEGDIRPLTPEEFVDKVAQAPLGHHPGTYWEYSLATDMLGRVVEAASGQRLGDFLQQRLFEPLGMVDTAFFVAPQNYERIAEALPMDIDANTPNRLYDVSTRPSNDSGGAGGVSTAADYLRFAQMMLGGGQLDGRRILSRKTVELMSSDHLGSRIQAVSPMTPGEILLGTPGYTFGLGFAVRQGNGIAGVAGSQGEFMWGGYAGTYFWIDPKEDLVAVYMTQAPSPIRAYYRKLFKNFVYAAIED